MNLYKQDSKGKIRLIEIKTSGEMLIRYTGIVGGKMVKHIKECTPKNTGKSNETSGREQATKEAENLITKKLAEGYKYTIEEAENNKVILPMLAYSYKDHKHKVKFPCYVQPKLDGIRCIKSNKVMLSRKNRVIDTLPHIAVVNIATDDVIDGELYAHGKSFQENVKLIKKNRPESADIKYHVYDMISDKPFVDRYSTLHDLVHGIDSIELVPIQMIKNEEELFNAHKVYLKQGYEGTIIRHGDKGYEPNKRSDSLLKYKDFLDVAIKIKDIIPEDVHKEFGSPVFDWEGAKGHRYGDNILGCGVKMSHKEREKMLTNKEDYIGKVAELRFFEYSNTGVPRFPVMVGIRIDK